ncbi:MAG: ABC transporter substrate-binding protein [Candidatus Gracilibacteria bacterium]
MNFLGKIVKFLLIVAVIGLFVWLTLNLFFPEMYKKLEAQFLPYLKPVAVSVGVDSVNNSAPKITERENLTIAFAQPIEELEPTFMDPETRNRLIQIYEPLVKTDRFLNISGALAIRYGKLDSNTWTFTIRPNVSFHNSKSLDVNDVYTSFLRAQNFSRSQMKNLLSGMHAEVVDKDTLKITTDVPDPLFLQKLSFVLIMPKDAADSENVKPVGTGAYRFVNWRKHEEMTFACFDNYWGEKPYVKNLKFVIMTDPEQRIKAISGGQVDLLANVPPSYIESLNKSKVDIKTMPSLEVTFLMFNMNSSIFSKKEMREAAARSIDKKRFMLSSVGYTKVVNQFISSGVFGFNQSVSGISYDLEKAAKTISATSEFESIPIKLSVPVGMVDIGKDIASMLDQSGFATTILSKAPEEFEESFNDDSVDLYLMGWKSDMGDASDFLHTIVHSKDGKKSFGMYNVGRYSNLSVDKTIEENLQEMNEKKRLKAFQDIMKIITEDDLIGIPLFETQIIYGVSKDIKFDPRADGQIFVSEIM